MALPAPLIEAIRALNGRAALIIGAGTSVEDPTGVPVSRECSLTAHKFLVRSGVIVAGDCDHPEDLALLADAVVSKTKGDQTILVQNLPIDKLRSAAPNRGHRIAAAMLREEAISAVLTLNFDIAMSAAVGQVGGSQDVAIIASEQDHGRLGSRTVVFLHGNAYADPSKWVLTTAALQTARASWIDVIATRVLSGPVTIFAGIGTRICSLVQSARDLRARVPVGRAIYNVDVAAPTSSEFFQSLELPAEAYLRRGWCDFMDDVSALLTDLQASELQEVCHQRNTAAGTQHGDVSHLCMQFKDLGLLEYGYVRARWLLSRSDYEPRRGSEPVFMADLVLAIEAIERASGRHAHIHEDGLIDFIHEGHVVGSTIVASGRGLTGAIAIEADLSVRRYWRRHMPRPLYAVLAGIEGDLTTVAPPRDLARPEREDDLIDAIEKPRLVTLQMVRQDNDLARRIVA